MERIERGVTTERDAERVRRDVRRLAESLGFDAASKERVTLAVMELASNLIRYARDGRLVVEGIEGASINGIRVTSLDHGPGIANVEQAMADGFSTGGGLGHGLPAVRRFLTDFQIESSPSGTVIRGHCWPATR